MRDRYVRAGEGREVAFVLNRRGGGVVRIEVMAAVKLGSDAFKGIADLADTVGKKFVAGVVLYQGTSVVAFGPKGWAIPLSALVSE